MLGRIARHFKIDATDIVLSVQTGDSPEDKSDIAEDAWPNVLHLPTVHVMEGACQPITITRSSNGDEECQTTDER
jgi:hypothetical protein